ncbi:MAG: hypothetical protein ABJC09_07085 [Terriglobia bacterium]
MVNPDWQSALLVDITVVPDEQSEALQWNALMSTQPAENIYTVQAGSSLSQISKKFYGGAGDFMKIPAKEKPWHSAI